MSIPNEIHRILVENFVPLIKKLWNYFSSKTDPIERIILISLILLIPGIYLITRYIFPCVIIVRTLTWIFISFSALTFSYLLKRTRFLKKRKIPKEFQIFPKEIPIFVFLLILSSIFAKIFF